MIKKINPLQIGVDLGTANTIIVNHERVLLNEPSIIAIDKRSSSIVAVGRKALDMHEKTHYNLKTIKPLKDGVIADYSAAEKMLREFVSISGSNKYSLGAKKFLICIPYYTTEVEKRAVRDSAQAAGASEVFMIHEPIAAGIGAGVDIFEPKGHMLVDIGGGTIEVAVLSLSSVVCNQSLRIGGNTFDKDIVDHVRRNYNLMISEKTAERTKLALGAAIFELENAPPPMQVVGRDLASGLPRSIILTHSDIFLMMDKTISQIEEGVLKTLEKCPPELSGDIYSNGIMLTGGGAFIRGLAKRLSLKTRLPVKLVQNPLLSVMQGITKCLNNFDSFQHVFIS